MTRPIVVRGDAAHLPLPDASVDLICTSPPYFALRDYGYAGQIGSEPTPAAYIAALVECTREWMRVLKPSGSCFVNLGDKYSGAQAQNIAGANRAGDSARTWQQTDPRRTGIPNKSLMLLPERYRVACVDQLGLIARAVIVWAKPNGLPESVTDRVRRSHEDWVHLVKQPRYFAAVDEIRLPNVRTPRPSELNGTAASKYGDGVPGSTPHAKLRSGQWNALGSLPGSVWEVATEPLQVPAGVDVDHFAAFPSEWPRRLVLGWSPSGVCTACGEGRRPVVDATPMQWRESPTLAGRNAPGASRVTMSGTMLAPASRTITGYACACTPYTDHPGTEGRDRDGQAFARETGRDAHPHGGVGTLPRTGPVREYHFDRWTPPPTRPSTVLDPFGGTGTTAHVAAALSRIGISVDLSLDYSRLAAHPELADRRRRKVLGLDKPVLPVIPEGQLGFDWEDVS